MSTPKLRKQGMVVGIVLLVLIIGAGIAMYSIIGGPTPPVFGSDETELTEDTDTSTASVWQTLFITNKDVTTYWVNPPETYKISLFGTPTGKTSDFKQVAKMQNAIYMKVDSDKQIQSWEFSCQETMTVHDYQGNQLATIVDSQMVNANGQSANVGKKTAVTSATITGDQLQSILTGAGIQPATVATPYQIRITLSNINLKLTYTDGQTQDLSTSEGTEENILRWVIAII